jgi:hypothetical protein
VVAVICDNVIIHRSKILQRWRRKHPRLRVLHGARSSPHDNPIERIWGALRTHLANSPTLTIQGRIRQVHAFFRARTLNSSWPPPPRPARCGRPRVPCRTIVRSLSYLLGGLRGGWSFPSRPEPFGGC